MHKNHWTIMEPIPKSIQKKIERIPGVAEQGDGNHGCQHTLQKSQHFYLVGVLEHEFYFSMQLGISSSQLTKSYFSEG